MAAIEVEGLSKRYRSVQAVAGLSFAVEAGRVTGFIGPNGAGKSTTLRMLLGLVRPDSGTASLDGPVGAALEDTSYHPGRSGRNHLRVVAVAGGHGTARVDELLERVGLSGAANQRVKGYSTGMRQRLGIAAALVGDPEILVLDEPANGLDPPGIRWIRDLLRAEADRGRAVLVSSHLLSELAQSVDDVLVIADGELRAGGPIERVLGGANGPVTRVRSRLSVALAAALGEHGHAFETEPSGGLVVRGATPEEVGLIADQHRIALIELGPAARSLEDAFLELTGVAS
ncbi:MAG TPA: ATP-binding cassette domain-containing protein [Thermoleophilaceae bacterium]|nr:ATP-binding cassette domain-containing protein [Thermoleophilaceae bacterium]